MHTWTLAFVSVAAIAALLGGAASWEGFLVAARIVCAVALAVALIAAARAINRQMSRPGLDAATWRHAPARRPYGVVGRLREHPRGTINPGERARVATGSRALRHAVEGETR